MGTVAPPRRIRHESDGHTVHDLGSTEPANWLQASAYNTASQSGEDGIIEAILRKLPETDRWCVEFGAWDGKHLSNTYRLISSDDYNAVLIEGNADRFKILSSNARDNPKVHPIQRYVGWSDNDNLDIILAATATPRDFDLLSIDIDGNDYHVWAAVKNYRPKLVVIEFNPSIPNAVAHVQPPDPELNQGSSLRAIVELGRARGYDLAAVTEANAFLIDHKYFDLLDIPDNSIAALQGAEPWVTHLFFGYDGSAHLTGKKVVPWHSVPLTDRQVQVIPWPLRRFPPGFGRIRRTVLLAYQGWTHLTRRSRGSALRDRSDD